MNGGLLILGWHNVEPTWFFTDRSGSGTHRLGRQLDVIRRVANVMPLTTALDALRAGRSLPPRSVALTFDDGYRDAVVAARLLEERGLPATFFLVAAFVDGRSAPWWEDLARAVTITTRTSLSFDGDEFALDDRGARQAALGTLASALRRYDHARRDAVMSELLDRLGALSVPAPQTRMLDWDDARELVYRGHAVGSHSLAHWALSREQPDDVLQDLAGSRAALEDRLGVGVETLAYPYGNPGDFDGVTESLAEAAGYRYALSTVPGSNGLDARWFALRRQVLDASAGVGGLADIRHSFGGLRGLAGHSRRADNGT